MPNVESGLKQHNSVPFPVISLIVKYHNSELGDAFHIPGKDPQQMAPGASLGDEGSPSRNGMRVTPNWHTYRRGKYGFLITLQGKSIIPLNSSMQRK